MAARELQWGGNRGRGRVSGSIGSRSRTTHSGSRARTTADSQHLEVAGIHNNKPQRRLQRTIGRQRKDHKTRQRWPLVSAGFGFRVHGSWIVTRYARVLITSKKHSAVVAVYFCDPRPHCTQRAQYPLIQEYTLNHSIKAPII